MTKTGPIDVKHVVWAFSELFFSFLILLVNAYICLCTYCIINFNCIIYLNICLIFLLRVWVLWGIILIWTNASKNFGWCYTQVAGNSRDGINHLISPQHMILLILLNIFNPNSIILSSSTHLTQNDDNDDEQPPLHPTHQWLETMCLEP